MKLKNILILFLVLTLISCTSIPEKVNIKRNTSQEISIINLERNKTLISFDEITLHNSTNDCWVLIEDKIYSTSNISLNYCGKNITNISTPTNLIYKGTLK